MDKHKERLLVRLGELGDGAHVWREPTMFNLGREEDVTALTELIESGDVSAVIDPIELIASDLFEHTYPQQRTDERNRAAFVDEVIKRGPEFGDWFYFPWSKRVVRYPGKETHRTLRTSRNRNLITTEEQAVLYDATVAVFGLSVGGSAVRQLALGGIGGRMIIADMDTISPSNTNRLEATQVNLGHQKIDVLAKYLSELDPYIEQVLLRDGVDAEKLEEITRDSKPDFIVDAVDSLPIKALIRSVGKEREIPVFMATDVGDRSIIDVEMYGIDNPAIFNGRLPETAFQRLLSGEAAEDEIASYTFSLVGPENATERMLTSAQLAFSGELPGIPQLGATATLGGVGIARVAREMLLGGDVRSGRSYIDTDQLLEQT